MKIDYCIISADLDMFMYSWPLVYKMWKEICDIEAKLIIIGNTIPEYLEKYKDSIILFEPVENIHTAYQAQCIRLLYPCLYKNKNIIISDADILPISKDYFITSIKDYNDDKFITYRDSYIEQQMYGVCYNAANSKTWKNIFNIESLDDIRITLKDWYNKGYTGNKNCPGWYTDQKMLFKYLQNWTNKINHIILTDNNMKFNRLDKKQRNFISKVDEKLIENIQNKVYTDFHFIRPYKRFKKSINIICNKILSHKS